MASKKTKGIVAFGNKNVGRRTGKDMKAGKNIKKMSDGFENFDDYWSESEADMTRDGTFVRPVTPAEDTSLKKAEASGVSQQQPPEKEVSVAFHSRIKNIHPKNPLTSKHIGRRTGMDMKAGKNIRIVDGGFENFDDYWSDSDADSISSFCTSSSYKSKLSSQPSTPVKSASKSKITKNSAILQEISDSNTVTFKEGSQPRSANSRAREINGRTESAEKEGKDKGEDKALTDDNTEEDKTNIENTEEDEPETLQNTETETEGNTKEDQTDTEGYTKEDETETQKTSDEDETDVNINTEDSETDKENKGTLLKENVRWKKGGDSEKRRVEAIASETEASEKNSAGPPCQAADPTEATPQSVDRQQTTAGTKADSHSDRDTDSQTHTDIDNENQDITSQKSQDSDNVAASSSQHTENTVHPASQVEEDSTVLQGQGAEDSREQSVQSENKTSEERGSSKKSLKRQSGPVKRKDLDLSKESHRDEVRRQSPRKHPRQDSESDHVMEVHTDGPRLSMASTTEMTDSGCKQLTSSNSGSKELPSSNSKSKQCPFSARKEAHSVGKKQSHGPASQTEKTTSTTSAVKGKDCVGEAIEQSEDLHKNHIEPAEAEPSSSSDAEKQPASLRKDDPKSKAKAVQKDALSSGQQLRSSGHSIITAQKSVSNCDSTSMSQINSSQSPVPTSQKSSVYLSVVGDVTGSITRLSNASVLTPEPKLYGTRRRLSYSESPEKDQGKPKTGSQRSKMARRSITKPLTSPILEETENTPEKIALESASQARDDSETDFPESAPLHKLKDAEPSLEEKQKKKPASPAQNLKKNPPSTNNVENPPERLTQSVIPETDKLSCSRPGTALCGQPDPDESVSRNSCSVVGQFISLASHTLTQPTNAANASFLSDSEDLGFEIVEDTKVVSRATVDTSKSNKAATGRSRNRLKVENSRKSQSVEKDETLHKKLSEKNSKKALSVEKDVTLHQKVSNKNSKKALSVEKDDTLHTAQEDSQEEQMQGSSPVRKTTKRSLSSTGQGQRQPIAADTGLKVRKTSSTDEEDHQREDPKDKKAKNSKAKKSSKKKKSSSKKSQGPSSADTEEDRPAEPQKARKVKERKIVDTPTSTFSSRRKSPETTGRRSNPFTFDFDEGDDDGGGGDHNPCVDPETVEKKTVKKNRSKRRKNKGIEIDEEAGVQEKEVDMQSTSTTKHMTIAETGTNTDNVTAEQDMVSDMESPPTHKVKQKTKKVTATNTEAGAVTQDAASDREATPRGRGNTTNYDNPEMELTKSQCPSKSAKRTKNIRAESTTKCGRAEQNLILATDSKSLIESKLVQKKKNAAAEFTSCGEPSVPESSSFSQSPPNQPTPKRSTRMQAGRKKRLTVEEGPAPEEQTGGRGRKRSTQSQSGASSEADFVVPGKRGRKSQAGSEQGPTLPKKGCRSQAHSTTQVEESYTQGEALREMLTPTDQALADMRTSDSALKSGISSRRFLRYTSSQQSGQSPELTCHDDDYGMQQNVEEDIVSSPVLAPSSVQSVRTSPVVHRSKLTQQLDSTPVSGNLSKKHKSKRKSERRVTISNVVEQRNFSPDDRESHEGDTTVLPSMSATPVHYYQQQSPTPSPEDGMNKNKIVLPEDNSTGLRRSTRTRVRRIEWYKNERIIYDRRKSGPVILGVQPSREHIYQEQENQKRRKRKQQLLLKKKQNRGPERYKRRLSTHVDLPSSMDITVSTDIPIVHPDSKQETFIRCLNPAARAPEMGPSGSSPSAGDPFSLRLITQQNLFTTGTLTLAPEGQKPLQRTMSTAVLYFITYGKVLVTINRATAVLETGDHFFVPRGTVYKLQNMRKEEAFLTFANLMIDQTDSPSS